MGVYMRGKIAWIRYADPSGDTVYESTGQRDRRVAERLYRQRKREIADGIWLGPKRTNANRLRVSEYAEAWLAKQKLRGLASWRNENQKLRAHVLPLIGSRVLADLRPKDVVQLVEELKRRPVLRGRGLLAPRTAINAYAVFSRMCRDAVIEEVIAATPCVLPSKTLPRKRDKDPTWRATAVFVRDEVETLISDERIGEDERVFYALMFFLGVRVGEASGRRWRDYDTSARPLGRMTIATQYDDQPVKQEDRPREMPVHPTLAAILAHWKLSGFARFFGRAPTPEDFIVPEPSNQWRRRGQHRNGKTSYRRLQDALVLLGFRRRRQHDARRTLVSLGRADGCDRDILRACTHGDRREQLDDYTTWPWDAKCREIAKIKLGRRGASVAAIAEA
jgi:integrase